MPDDTGRTPDQFNFSVVARNLERYELVIAYEEARAFVYQVPGPPASVYGNRDLLRRILEWGRAGSVKTPDETAAWVYREHRSGVVAREIAQALGVSRSTARNMVRRGAELSGDPEYKPKRGAPKKPRP